MKRYFCRTCGQTYDAQRGGLPCPSDGTPLIAPAAAELCAEAPWLGHAIDDRYRLFDVLGTGGFGAVYRAYDAVSGIDVAIKVVADSSEMVAADAKERFRQEARLLESLQSDHIVDVLGFGEYKNALYMVLELIPGKTLKEMMEESGALDLHTATHITSQILTGLSTAHAQGLVHRDLKPANILVDEDANHAVTLIDFGIAKVIGAQERESPKTQTGMVLGTVRYMAPEQLKKDGLAGAQTDLYSVGVIFYEMLSGQSPYAGSQAEIAAAILYSDSPSLLDLGQAPALNAWFGRVMSKQPEHRYVDALTMKADLIHEICDETITEQLTQKSVLGAESLTGSLDRFGHGSSVDDSDPFHHDSSRLNTDHQIDSTSMSDYEDTVLEPVDISNFIQASGTEGGRQHKRPGQPTAIISASTRQAPKVETADPQDALDGTDQDDLKPPATVRIPAKESERVRSIGTEGVSHPREQLDKTIATDAASNRVYRSRFWWMLPSLTLLVLCALLMWFQLKASRPTSNQTPSERPTINTHRQALMRALDGCQCLKAQQTLALLRKQFPTAGRDLIDQVKKCRPAVEGQCRRGTKE
ncbi:MAG: serine/threonine-protein kinase [Myxococcota bacterium]|nr:serine/threonine-protein kinase [Myxococcota bacterium]